MAKRVMSKRASTQRAQKAKGSRPARAAEKAVRDGAGGRVDAGALQREARRLLEAQVDPAYLVKIRELVPTGSPVIGVRVPVIRAMAKEFVAGHSEIDVGVACDLYDACCLGGGGERCREEMLFAQVVLERFRRRLDGSVWARVDRWVDAIDNWEVCDQLSKNIAAAIVVREPRLVKDLKTWAGSDNFWRRRFVMATTTSLNQGGRSNVALTLELCGRLMKDEHLMVQKAVGWAIREAQRKEPEAVRAFLERWKGKAHPRVLREAGVRKDRSV